MTPRWMAAALLVLVAGITLGTSRTSATHPFEDSPVFYSVELAHNKPRVPSDLLLSLRFAAPSTLPEPFGGIVHQTPAPWGIAADEEVPDGDDVAHLGVFLDHPLIMEPSAPCPAAPIPPLELSVPLVDASSDSTAADYPPFLPPGEHKARWTGEIEHGEDVIPVNVLVDPHRDGASGGSLRLFVGTGEGGTGLPPLDEAELDLCFSLSVSLNVAAESSSGVPVAVNPSQPGEYVFVAELRSMPDPTEPPSHTIILKAGVLIKGAPAAYEVDLRDHNPGVATDLLMGLSFRPKSPLPRPFGGVTHRAPPEWGIAADEDVPDGDVLARLRLRLAVPAALADVCASVLPERPSLALSVPLHDASSDSSASDYPPFLPPGEHKARWTGVIGRPEYGIPVNVLVDETLSEGTAMQIFVGRGLHHVYFRPLAKCLALNVALQVAGHSRSGVPVAVNPEAEGTYIFHAHIVTLPKPEGEPREFDLKAEVKIEESPLPEPCLECPPGDGDGDIIVDEIDLCPQEPEDADGHDVTDGCPDSGDDDTDELLNLVELLVGSDPTSQDSDGDGCTDGRELGSDEKAGGRRDPTDRWDFYDTNGDRVVDLVNDVFAVADAFDLVAADPGYSTALDRSPPLLGENPWKMGPPDGIIDLINDVFGVADQFDHRCQGPP